MAAAAAEASEKDRRRRSLTSEKRPDEATEVASSGLFSQAIAGGRGFSPFRERDLGNGRFDPGVDEPGCKGLCPSWKRRSVWPRGLCPCWERGHLGGARDGAFVPQGFPLGRRRFGGDGVGNPSVPSGRARAGCPRSQEKRRRRGWLPGPRGSARPEALPGAPLHLTARGLCPCWERGHLGGARDGAFVPQGFPPRSPSLRRRWRGETPPSLRAGRGQDAHAPGKALPEELASRTARLRSVGSPAGSAAPSGRGAFAPAGSAAIPGGARDGAFVPQGFPSRSPSLRRRWRGETLRPFGPGAGRMPTLPGKATPEGLASGPRGSARPEALPGAPLHLTARGLCPCWERGHLGGARDGAFVPQGFPSRSPSLRRRWRGETLRPFGPGAGRMPRSQKKRRRQRGGKPSVPSGRARAGCPRSQEKRRERFLLGFLSAPQVGRPALHPWRPVPRPCR